MINTFNTKQKTIDILFFLHNSSGELFTGLPILHTVKKHLDVNIFFISKKKNILDTWNIDTTYRKKMEEIGTLHFGNFSSLYPLILLRKSNNQKLIMSCYSGMRSIDKLYYILLKRSTFVFYPHSNGLLSIKEYDFSKFNEYYKKKKEKFESKFGKYSYLFSISEQENEHFEHNGWESKRIIPISALGYNKEWQSEIIKTEKIQPNIKHLNIFIPLREQKEPYFTKDDYTYILESFYTLFKTFPQHNFFVKFHPRQHDIADIQYRLKKFENTSITFLNPYEAAKKCDLTISVSSSILQDSIAVGTPAIEFHKHTIFHPQLMYKAAKLVSFYAKLELVEFYDDINELIDFLNHCSLEKLNKLYDKQLSIFNAVFHSNENNIRVLEAIKKVLAESTLIEKEKKDEKRKMLLQYLTKSFK